MKRAEIDKIFARMLGEYLDKGYVINTNTMAGHQGEVAKVDLRKGDEFVRMNLAKGHDYRDGGADYYVLTVGRTDKYIRPDDHETIWTDRLDEVERHVIYQIGDDWYSGNEDYTEDCMLKRKARLHRRWYHYDPLEMKSRSLPDCCRKVALKLIRKVDRCKSVKLCDIKSVRVLRDDCGVEWVADVRGKTVRFAKVSFA